MKNHDFYWGSSYRDPDMVKTIRALDRQLAKLNDFQNQPPKLDLLIIFGNTAQNNWYPDADARNLWDINGKLDLFPICDEIWNQGFRAAMVPDYAISDGRVRFENGTVSYRGHTFTHLLFLYPRYAKKDVCSFLDRVSVSGFPMAVVGDADIDFDADRTVHTFPTFPKFEIGLLENIGCPRSGIPDGCVYRDGSFCLVTRGLLTGETSSFDFTIDGNRYTGTTTGLLACRDRQIEVMSDGSRLFVNGAEICP